jgi:predicted dehydrogenase
VDIYFDAQVTSRRAAALKSAIANGKHIYTEKPTAETLQEAIGLAQLARDAGITAGVVHDKLYLPGLVKLRRLVDEGFFGKILSLRGEFGYWVFEGDIQPAQRPSWNYRAQDGGGMTVDMFCHWNYVLEGILGRVESVIAKTATHIPTRWDEQGRAYPATADDASYAIFELAGGIVAQINSSWAVRVYRDELVEFQVDGTHGSAVAGLNKCVAQQRAHTPKPVWNPDLPVTESFRDQWLEVPANTDLDNGFKLQWEEFLRDVAAGREHRFGLLSAARGVQLAELGLRSSAEGRRLEIPEITL